MPEQSDINATSFTERFSKRLFECFPEWRLYAVKPDFRWQSECDLAVEVPSRFRPLCPLRVETMGDGVIVSWVGWHVHCDDWCEEFKEEEYVAEALCLLDDILAERRVVITVSLAGRIVSGGNSLVRDLDRDLDTAWSIYCKDRELAVVSWNGTYDRGKFDPTMCK